jgi:hypothetical protein
VLQLSTENLPYDREGWWVENANATSDAVLLYFGGNAEDALYAAGTISKLSRMSAA